MERAKKWNDRRYFIFFSGLWLESGKVEDKKLFYLVEKKKWEDQKYNLYKFTLLPLLDINK